MRGFRALSLAEQVAEHLRREIVEGMVGPAVPGVHRLSAELGVHHKTAEEALRLLEREGVVVGQGVGRRRRVSEGMVRGSPALRIGILAYEDDDRTQHFLSEIRHGLQDAGHSVEFARRTLLELGMDAKRVARHVGGKNYDAWLVVAGSRPVLEWFGTRAKPVFALFGRRQGVPIAGAGPDKVPAALDALDRLVALGHRRIVMMMREEHRLPKPGFFAQSLLAGMARHGLQTGAFNLPEWENHPEGLRSCLDMLFRFTPPTAMILDEAHVFQAVREHLARRGILAPEQVSLVCTDPDPAFEWSSPSVAHIRWDRRQLVRRVVGWAERVSRGKVDRRQSLIRAEFVDGGTMGAVREADGKGIGEPEI